MSENKTTTTCPKCAGTGWYHYSHNHSKPCEVCCQHDKGYWQLHEHYGDKNGKWACLAGCGNVRNEQHG